MTASWHASHVPPAWPPGLQAELEALAWEFGASAPALAALRAGVPWPAPLGARLDALERARRQWPFAGLPTRSLAAALDAGVAGLAAAGDREASAMLASWVAKVLAAEANSDGRGYA